MYPQGRYNINFNFCAVILSLLLLFFYSIRHSQMRMREKLFRDMLGLLGVSASFEVVFLIMQNVPAYFIYELSQISLFISTLAHNVLPYFVAMYVIHYLGIQYGWNKKRRILYSIPVWITVVLLALPWTRDQIYFLTREGDISYGWLYNWIYLADFFYVLSSLYMFIRSSRALNKRLSVMGFTFILLGALSIAASTQAVYLRATNFIQVMLMLCVLMTVENEEDFVEPVTGLGTRQAFMVDAEILFSAHYPSTVFAMKLQNYEYYHAIFGTRGANLLLRQIAKWMLEKSSERCSNYYLGQGIYAVIQYNCAEEEVNGLQDQIMARFRERWQGPHLDVMAPMQLWRADIPEKVDTLEKLMGMIDPPFDEKLGFGQVITSDENRDQKRRIQVEQAINRALQEGGFQVYYQPIYDTRRNIAVSAEALIRLIDPELGFIPPDEFIRLAELNGSINQIGEYVFTEVCRFLSERKPEQFGFEFMEVNLSTIQCLNENLPEILQGITKKYGVDNSRISLEITESAVIYNRDAVLRNINALREAGFHFALDDFGTGYSNYSYIITLPLSIIKIDKSILWAADEDQQKDRVLQHMIMMAKDLDLSVVVEGIETDAQREKLARYGVDYIQGYYYSKPIPEEPFLHYLEDKSWAKVG